MVSHHKMVSPQMVSPQDGSTRGGPPPPQATPLRGNSTENRNSNTICTFKNGWWEFANKAPLATPLLFFFLECRSYAVRNVAIAANIAPTFVSTYQNFQI